MTPARTPAPSRTPTPITLSLTGKSRKTGPTLNVDLTWSPTTFTGTIDVYRNGLLVQTTPDDGATTDANVSKAKHTYRVCRTGSATCSGTITVNVR